MTAKLRPEQRRGRYEIVNWLSSGEYAISYEARSDSGRRVFFKQYKSPTPTIDWFQGFVDYQQEIKRRICSDPAAKARCYEFIEFFVEAIDSAGKYEEFYQVFEFVEGGMSLQKCLDKLSDDPHAFTWEQRVIFARVMMSAVAALHKLKIVHTDLKPDNIILLPQKSGDYWLRVIDLDGAILVDRRAPWHGERGYVGTPNYLSPEHQRGEVPLPASDVFTCGLMLGELLGGRHPFADAADYGSGILDGRGFKPVSIREPLPKIPDQAFVEAVVNSCFDPDPAKRPTAQQAAEALMGKTFAWGTALAPRPAPKPAAPRPAPVPPASPKPAAVRTTTLKAIELYLGDRKLHSVSIDTTFGRHHFRSLDDAKFLAEQQFRLSRDPATSAWVVSPVPEAVNETIVNGAKLESPVALEDGMRIAVGNTAKGVERLPLTVRLRAA